MKIRSALALGASLLALGLPATAHAQSLGDIPADTAPQTISDRQPVWTSVVAGRRYELALDSGGEPVHAGQTVVGTITVNDASGKPFTSLEPVMGAFAHIVGFAEDLHTVLHIHPYGKEPTSDNDRAGPAFAFKFYSPTPGFFRVYSQVQINGQNEFAPFGLTILPAENSTAR